MNEETPFRKALALSKEDRAAFLGQACQGRPELRAAVEALVAAYDKPNPILDAPLVNLADNLGDPPNRPEIVPGKDRRETTMQPEDPMVSSITPSVSLIDDALPITSLEILTKPKGNALPSTVEARQANESSRPFQRGTVLRYFGDYEIRETLGRGGMGVVYLARQVSPNRRANRHDAGARQPLQMREFPSRLHADCLRDGRSDGEDLGRDDRRRTLRAQGPLEQGKVGLIQPRWLRNRDYL